MESSIWGLPCAPFSFCTIPHPRMIGSDPCPVSPTPSAANRRGNWQELIEPRQLFASQIKRWHIGPVIFHLCLHAPKGYTPSGTFFSKRAPVKTTAC